MTDLVYDDTLQCPGHSEGVRCYQIVVVLAFDGDLMLDSGIILTFFVEKPDTQQPSKMPSKMPNKDPTVIPTNQPTKFPTETPTRFPTDQPTKFPTI